MFNNRRNIQDWSFSAISSLLQKSLNVIWAGRGICMLLDAHTHTHTHTHTHSHAHGPGRVPQTTAPGGDVLASASIPKFPARILQSSFPPTSQAARSSYKQRGERKHALGSIYCCEDASSCIPCGRFASSKSKHGHENSHWPYKKVKLKHQGQRKKKQNKFRSGHLRTKGVATVKAPLFWFVLHATHTCRCPSIMMYLHNTAYRGTHWHLEKAFTVIASWRISLQITLMCHPVISE